MNYLTAIKTAIFVFPLIAFVFTIPFILHQYHKYGAVNKFRVFVVYSFILYMITIYFLVILPLPKFEDVVNNTFMIRLEPFAFVKDFINESSFVLSNPSTYIKAMCEPCFYIVVFNIFMTIPFGMYLRYYFKCNLKKVFVFGFLLSLFFELTQLTGLYFIYPEPYRLFDLDDLFLNTLGAVIGYFIMGFIDNFLPTRDDIDKQSMEQGKIVSGFRRFTIFMFDLFIFLQIALLCYLFCKLKITIFMVFGIYYLLIPVITKGYTLGSLFLNVKIEYEDNFILKTIFRNIFVFIYYLGIPLLLYISADYLVHHHFVMIIYLILIFSLILFYPVNFILLMKNKKRFYDKLFGSNYISTIK